MLAHRVVGSGLDDHVGARLHERGGAHHEGNAVVVGKCARWRCGTAPGDGHHPRIAARGMHVVQE